MLKYFFSILLALEISSAFSQDSTRAEVVVPADTIPNKYLPTGLRLGVDLISIIKSQLRQDFTGWEVNADVDFYRYFFAVDYGTWAQRDSITLQPHAAPISLDAQVPFKPIIIYPSPTTRGKYENQGHYFRLGMDVNFLLKDPERNMVFIGFRYGFSFYNESLNYIGPDPTYGSYTKTISANNLKGHWAELTSGIRIKIFPGFWMGYTARLKFAPSSSGGNGQLLPYAIPGYGLAEHGIYWGFNYQVFWRIPFRKIK